MATLEQLEKRIIEADAAGRTEDVKILADEIRKRRAEQQVQTEQPVQPEELITSERLNVAKDIAADVGRSAAKGGVTGITGLAGLPALAEELSPTRRAVQYLPTLDPTLNLLKKLQERGTFTGKPGYLFPSQQQLIGLIEKIPQAEKVTQYEPKTTAGEYAETISEFVAPGGLFARTGQSLGTAAKIGGIGGTVQESQEQIGLSPLAALPLTLLSTLGAGYALSPSRASRYAQESLKGVSDEELALAASIERQAEELGIRLTAPELIDNKVLQGVGQIVYGSDKGGEIMYNYVKNRPQEINKVAKKLLDQIIEQPESVRKIYKNINTTANKAVKNAKIERRLKAEDAGYNVSNTENLTESQVLTVIEEIDQAILGFGQKSPSIKKLKQLKTRLTKDKKNTIPETNIRKLASAKREFRDAVIDSELGVAKGKRSIDKETAFALFNDDGTGVLDILENQLRTNKSYANGQDTFAKLSDEIVNPILDHLGPLAQKKLTPAKIKSFVFEPTKNNMNDISKTYNVLNKIDKTAFPNIARSYIENAANNAFVAKSGGESLKSGFDLYKSLAGTPNQKNNFEEVLRGVAKANGSNPKDLIDGFTKFNNVLKNTAKIVNLDDPKIAPTARNLPQEVAQIGSFMWRIKFASRYGEFLKRRTMEDLAKVFTQRNSVDELVKLAKTDPESIDAINIVINLIAASRPFNELQEEQVTQE